MVRPEQRSFVLASPTSRRICWWLKEVQIGVFVLGGEGEGPRGGTDMKSTEGKTELVWGER